MADCKKLVKLLPDEYQELEYIQNGSSYRQTGYIDTGLVGTDLYGCEIETCMKVTASVSDNLYYLNGAYVSGQTTQTGLIREDNEYVHSVVNMGFNTASYSGSIALNDWHTIYTSDGIQKTDNAIVSNETYGTFNNLHYLLFARSDAVAYAGVTISPPFAMKYFWIKKNGQYIRNMIPAKRKSDNVVGMYDIANDVFYTSENQYTFIGGDAVAPVWLHSLRKLTTATDTITTLPADIYADGTNATVGLVGNMSQTGTPTPSSPITPSECGERTENLFDYETWVHNANKSACTVTYETNGFTMTATGSDPMVGVTCGNGDALFYGYKSQVIPVEGNTTYTISLSSAPKCYISYIDATYTGCKNYDRITESSQPTSYTFTTPASCKYILLRLGKVMTAGDTYFFSKPMLNTGNEAKTYEPHGYKLDIKSASTTTPVYLGEVESTRRIRKYECKGDENIIVLDLNNHIYGLRGVLNTNPELLQVGGYCTHYSYNNAVSSLVSNMRDGDFVLNKIIDDYSITVKDDAQSTGEAFKQYLANQYAAGTPVCVWYVLATETTGIVNEPLRKIGDYADSVSGITIPTTTGKDTFDVLTTLKPSEVELTYTGWHDASVGEWDGSEWQ